MRREKKENSPRGKVKKKKKESQKSKPGVWTEIACESKKENKKKEENKTLKKYICIFGGAGLEKKTYKNAEWVKLKWWLSETIMERV